MEKIKKFLKATVKKIKKFLKPIIEKIRNFLKDTMPGRLIGMMLYALVSAVAVYLFGAPLNVVSIILGAIWATMLILYLWIKVSSDPSKPT